jgi:serine/threonine protein kinase
LPGQSDRHRLICVADQLVVGGQLGNYLIDSVIGRGGMSVVFGAKHARLGMPVALKVLAPELSSDDTFRERFLHEAQIAAGIDHPNVIPIHDMGLHESSLYIVMRYVAGGDLKTLLSDAGPLQVDRALELLGPIALALDTAHAHGLVHRDVKPANILLQRSAAGEVEHVYLTDFGIAKSRTFGGALTATGASVGTVGYMAPEQMEAREVSAQTDVYALAVTLYECLTGRIPFQRELAEGVRPPVGPLEPVSAVRPDVPAALDQAIAKALSRNPADRQPSCDLFLQACRDAVADRAPHVADRAAAAAATAPASSPTASAQQPPESAQDARHDPRHPRRAGQRRRAALLVVLAAIALAAVVIALTSGSSAPPGRLSASVLEQVPANHVSGAGQATVRLNGNQAAVSVTTSGLDSDAELVHLIHIHGGGKGQCPPASAARLHNGHLAISTTDGINYYGPPVEALTTHGDTGVGSILAFPRFPSGGNLHYTRTIVLPPSVAAEIRRNNAVVVVHGTDYDHSGIYSGVLDPSELNKGVPGTATAPALCGPLRATANGAADSGSRGHEHLYTAVLQSSAVQSSSVQGGVAQGGVAQGAVAQVLANREIFFCHLGAALPALPHTRRAGIAGTA